MDNEMQKMADDLVKAIDRVNTEANGAFMESPDDGTDPKFSHLFNAIRDLREKACRLRDRAGMDTGQPMKIEYEPTDPVLIELRKITNSLELIAGRMSR